MKKWLFFMLTLAVAAQTFCQQNNPSPAFSQEDFLTKSKHQKTTARFLLGGGSMVAAAGMIIGFGDALNTIFSPEEASSSNTGEVLFYTGLVAMAGSVPLFIASSRNKNKAASVSALFKMEHRSVLEQQSLVRAAYPALVLKISL